MAAHQIIYTSCRRGIEGTSDGFQVFSYDEGLPSIPAAGAAQGYNALFADPVPHGLGFSILGYHPLDDDYCLLSHNTRLPHDYMGPQGRSGNMLRQSLLIPWADVTFAPVELVGSPVLRSQMGPEVQSAERPAYLPCVSLAPAGEVTFDGVCEWLEDEDLADSMGELLAKLFAAKASGKQLVIVGTAAEAANLIGAVSYALPLRLARQVSFVLGADDASEASGDIINASSEAVAAAPDYVSTGWIVFDPHNPDASGSLGGADGYLGFVELSYSLNPGRLTECAQFAGTHTTAGLALGELDAAHDLWALLAKGDPLGDTSRLLRELPFAESSADEETNARLVDLLLGSIDALADQGLDVLVPVLGYLLRHVALLDVTGREALCAVAFATVSRLLSDPAVTPEDFPKRLWELCDSCSLAGLDLLHILQRDAGATALLAPGEVSDVRKIATLLLVLARSAFERGCTAEDAGPTGELGRFAARTIDAACALDVDGAKEAVHAYIKEFAEYLDAYEDACEAVVPVFENALPQKVDELWAGIAAKAPYAQEGELPRGLVWLSDHGRERDMGTMFASGLGHGLGLDGAAELYGSCCRSGFTTHDALEVGYPDVTYRYVLYLQNDGTERARAMLRSLVEQLASAAPTNELVCSRAIADAMLAASKTLVDDIRANPSEADLATARALYGYGRAAGRQVLGPRGMLALALDELARASQDSLDANLYQGIPEMIRDIPGLLQFSRAPERERGMICDALAEGVLGCCADLGGFAHAMAAVSDACRFETLEACAMLAAKRARGRQGTLDRLALVLSYVAVYCVGDDAARDAMARAVSKAKLEDRDALKRSCAYYCGPQALAELGIEAPADVAQQIDGILAEDTRRGGFPFFRR